MPANKSVSWSYVLIKDRARNMVTHQLVQMMDNNRCTVRLFPIGKMTDKGTRYTGAMQRLDTDGKVSDKPFQLSNGKAASLSSILEGWKITKATHKFVMCSEKSEEAYLRKYGKRMNSVTVIDTHQVNKKDGTFQKVYTVENPHLWDEPAKLEGPIAATPEAAHKGWLNKYNEHFNCAIHFSFPASQDQQNNADAMHAAMADMF